jgi:hypothetical protein
LISFVLYLLKVVYIYKNRGVFKALRAKERGGVKKIATTNNDNGKPLL